MSNNEKEMRENLEDQRKEKLREEIEKQPKLNSKGKSPEEMASLQKQYEDAKTEKLKREMALAKYESDFLMAKVPKEKTDALKKLIENIENKGDDEDLVAQKKENIAKKIALEKEIAQIKEQNMPLLDKELENKESEYAKEYIKLISAIDEQNKKVTEARLKFEGIDERPPLKIKKSPQNPIEAYDTGSPRFGDKKSTLPLKEPTNDVKSNIKDLNLFNVERFLKEQYKDNKYKLHPTSQQLEITLQNKSTITLEKDKISTSSDSKEDQLFMIQMYLQSLANEGNDLSKVTLTAKGKDAETTEWLQTKANEMKNKFIEQHKKGEFNLTSESGSKDKLELGHKETSDKPITPTRTSDNPQTNDGVDQQTRPRF